jgi:hypothetical protein
MDNLHEIEEMIEKYEQYANLKVVDSNYLNLISVKVGLAIAKELREIRSGGAEVSEEEEFAY